MRDHLVVILALAGCGRVGFELRTGDAPPSGHDEDGDGIADVDDVCPCQPGSQADGDGDRVGDDCDPNPALPRDAFAVVATMQPGAQPFLLFGDGTWTQLGDALAFDGPPDDDRLMSAHLELPMAVGDVRVSFGVDVLDRIEPGDQFQFAVGVRRSLAEIHYAELNEVPAFARAQIEVWNGSMFFVMASQNMPRGVHAGTLQFEATFRIGGTARLDAGWPGDTYQVEWPSSSYQGGGLIEVNVNNLDMQIRHACVITSS
jgi:hypothetical protein